MQPAKRVVVVAVATVTSKESGVAAARLWTAVAAALAVYIRFWLDLCHLINQTNTRQQHHENKPKLWGLQGVQVCSSLSYKRDSMELASRPKNTHTHTHTCSSDWPLVAAEGEAHE